MNGEFVAPRATADDYRIIRRLGMGGCGAAYLAENQTYGQVVLKFANEIWRNRSEADDRDASEKSENYRQMLKEEFSIMQMFSNPHILKAYFLNEEGVIRRNGVERQTTHLYSVNQYAEGGTLLFYLSGGLPEPIAKKLFIQLITGLQAMHSQGFVHKDLKPENLLLTSDYSLLIADFGHATQLDANGMVTQDGVKNGTQQYNPPEAGDHKVQGVPLDLFMAAAVFFFLLSGRAPFSEKGAVPTDPFYNFFTTGNPAGFWNAHAQKTHAVSQETKSLISTLLAPNPFNRPSHQDILGHPSLTQNVASSIQVRAEFEQRHNQAEKIQEQQVDIMIDRQEKFLGHFQASSGHHRGIITDACIEGLLEKNNNEVREFIVEISEETNFMEQEDEDYIPDIRSNNKLYYSPLDRDDLLKLLAITAVNVYEVSVEELKESVIENEVKSFNLDHFQPACRGQHG